MNKKGMLSSAFNMSLGFIPVIISIFLCEIMTQDMAIYIGTGIGIISLYLTYRRKQDSIPNFILYLSTGILILVSLASLIPGEYIPFGALPLTLEVSILIPMLILFIHKKKIIHSLIEKIAIEYRSMYTQGIEAAIVSARIILLLGILHFLLISTAIIRQGTPNADYAFFLYQVLPLLVFIISILLNQIAIVFFNRLLSHSEYIPIVNNKGNVIGKTLAIDTLHVPNTYIYPVIRIAVSTHGMLFLCKRHATALLDKNKIDIPMECYLKYGETLAEGAQRLIHTTFPHANEMNPQFSILYHFQNQEVNRLVYLFIIDLKDDSILSSCRFKGSKLWSFNQIEANLGKNFFCSCFEEEYQHLKSIIYIREKYKES